MANDVHAVAGQRFFIGTDPVDLPEDDLIEGDFTSVDWIEIGGWQTAGANGDNAALITTALINRARDVKQKGTRNAGSMQNNFALDRTDLGQVKLREAEASDLNYPFRILGNDEPAVGTAPTPSERLFYGIVMGASEQGGQANTAQMLQTTIEINSNIVTIAASAGAAPVNLTLPAISGIAQQGVALTAYNGNWSGGVTSYTYQWKNEGVNIGGATGQSYTPVAGDVGDNLTVVVTAVNSAGSTPATSAETTPVLAP
jgi:hypothetical protein